MDTILDSSHHFGYSVIIEYLQYYLLIVSKRIDRWLDEINKFNVVMAENISDIIDITDGIYQYFS